MDGSTVYDALELSFNTIDKTSILKINRRMEYKKNKKIEILILKQ